MQVTEAAKQQFQEQGYWVAPNFFSSTEVAALQAELEALVDAGKLRNVATDDDGQNTSQSAANLQICPLSPASRVFRSLPHAEPVRQAVYDLLGEPFNLHLDQIFLKPAGHGAGTNWHQDNSYFRVSDVQAGVGMWIAVHDATVANGTMHIVPGSHTRAREHVRDGGSDHHICCQVDESVDTVLPIEMNAGGALFFNFGVVHCTRGNTTDRPRAGLALHFLKRRFPARAGASQVALWGDDYDGGQQNWGEDLRGVWASHCAADASRSAS